MDSFEEWSVWPWESNLDLGTFLDHMQRVLAADMTKPIILTADGWIMDGAHRLVRARFEGHHTIPAVQFDEMPDPDRIEEGDET